MLKKELCSSKGLKHCISIVAALHLLRSQFETSRRRFLCDVFAMQLR